MSVNVFGIRHHGPGSARSLRAALEQLNPDIVLIEGPPEAEAIIHLAAHEDMQPPVALLIYPQNEPARAVYYPFATFSPELQAIRFALGNNIPVQFMDLPPTHKIALQLQAESEQREAEESELEDHEELEAEDSGLNAMAGDPLQAIAEAAGYEDGERWWEHMVEERRDGEAVFQGIAEAMGALREALGDHPGAHRNVEREQKREAWMRRTIRKAEKEGYENIAVVCGAWHVPALQNMPTAKSDNALLKALPKVKVSATWVPWTYSRLTLKSGYGAGVSSPGWYHHLWDTENQVSIRWLTRVAQLLRDEGFDISPAHIIETLRLSETLAAMRGRTLPGLHEMNESICSVMLFGQHLPLRLIEQKLIVSERMGQVPEETPQTPLQADLAKEQKRLRLKPTAEDKELVLDLRKTIDLDRSHLFRRLEVLGVDWGKGGQRASGKGTFKESWRLKWQPEFAVKIIEAGAYGNTILQAATSSLITKTHQCDNLQQLAAMARLSMLADLQDAIAPVMKRLEAVAAVASDVTHLMSALPELARLLRYGDVRNTDAGMAEHLVEGLVARICIGLPPATSNVNEDAAEALFTQLLAVNEAVNLLDRQDYKVQWRKTLIRIADRSGTQGLLQGRCCRLLLDAGALEDEAAAKRFSLALSVAQEPAQAAGWIDGFLRDSGQILIYDETLWALIDDWLCGLPNDSLIPLLPLLRRTFSTFSAPERRELGDRAKQAKGAAGAQGHIEDNLNHERGAAVLPLVSRLLGLEKVDG